MNLLYSKEKITIYLMKNHLLYIGLNGFAGSGKDTVAKALRTMLNYKWESFEQFKKYYDSYHGYAIRNQFQFATFESSKDEKQCMCIAFADQLKLLCSDMFGVSIDRFYYNKANSWICINKDFSYTEVKPDDNFIIDAEDFYTGYDNYTNSSNKYYMSLRELLVYVGTYVLQKQVNKNIFINIVNNTINRKLAANNELKYVIITDVRFLHELDYIKEKNGITINIVRDGVKQLDNIAEHDLDNEEDFDFIIDNNGTYEELFKQVWDMVHDNPEFENEIVEMQSRDFTDNYLRVIEKSENIIAYKLCSEFPMMSERRENGQIVFIDPMGGPIICIGQRIEGTDVYPIKIELAETGYGYIIYGEKICKNK